MPSPTRTYLTTLLILSTLLTISNALGSCGISYIDGECVEDIDEWGCVYTNGTYYEGKTCVEAGLPNTGSCCYGGLCRYTSFFVCTFVFSGTWKPGKECDCGSFQSCCYGGECEDGVDVESCESGDGVHYNVSCDVGRCFLNEKFGACCDAGYDGTCYEMPEKFCVFDWSDGPCSESTCPGTPLEPVPQGNSSNTTFPGRCCGRSCDEEFRTDCDDLYEVGLGCHAGYPCYPIGSCYQGDVCIEGFPEYLCTLGTWILGGECNNFSNGSCYTNDYSCNFISLGTCKLLNGTYFEGQECPKIYGACCKDDKCSDGLTEECVLTELFRPNATCDEEAVCEEREEDISCCFFDTFCFSDKVIGNENVCQSQGSTFLEGLCPTTGLCSGNQASLVNEVYDISNNINLKDVEFLNNNTRINFFGSLSVDSSTVQATNSTLSISEFKVTGSSLVLSDTSKISISGCIDVEDSTLVVNIDSNLNYQSTQDNPTEILSYNCINGDFSSMSVLVNGQTDDCIILERGFTSILLFQQDSCQEPTEFSLSPPLVVSITLSILWSLL